MVFSHLTNDEMATKVRMLTRSDLDHEAVCVGARDRIKSLASQIEKLEAENAGLKIDNQALCVDRSAREKENKEAKILLARAKEFCVSVNDPATASQYIAEDIQAYLNREDVG
jgi:hypothetical protein